MYKAVLNRTTIAETAEVIMVDNIMYFPINSIKKKYFSPSSLTTFNSQKGEAGYFHITVQGITYHNAAWYYKSVLPEVTRLRDKIAFSIMHGVEIRKSRSTRKVYQ